jgi:hypothetical protein
VAGTVSGCMEWPPIIAGMIHFRVLVTQCWLVKSDSQEVVEYFIMNNFRATLQIAVFGLSAFQPHISCCTITMTSHMFTHDSRNSC